MRRVFTIGGLGAVALTCIGLGASGLGMSYQVSSLLLVLGVVAGIATVILSVLGRNDRHPLADEILGALSHLGLPLERPTRLVVEYRHIYPGVPIVSPTHMLHLMAIPQEQGGGGLGVVGGGVGEAKAWPAMQFECDVIGYGDAALVNVEMSVGLVFQTPIPIESGIRAGDVHLERMWNFTIPRLEIGASNKFTFYILDNPDYVVTVGFWPEARGQRVDRGEAEVIPVTVVKGTLPITLFPRMGALINNAQQPE